MNNIIRKMEWAEKYLSILLFLAMLSVLTIQIVSRYFFSVAIPWTEELSRWLYIYIVFIGASEAVSRRDHIAVDIVPNRLGVRANLILDILIHGSFTVISVFIVYRGYLFMERMDRLGSITMDVQMSCLYAAVPIGFALVFVKSILNAGLSLSKLFQQEKGSTTAIPQ
ncbi:TRAP transporter small permease [Vibrio mediterranei]|uniref:TRAP transporter small permease n=1 Tax=Vibrio mediterranei TaxID=689 RepID=UPI00148E438A|nr:TRAP transporter small permease [Vibrio mediterranei]MCG9626392.1 TRAP transporter small permease [Vibrio mediterranei]NOH27167.1 TRAP transporter small permease [Vibrio mediterranei]